MSEQVHPAAASSSGQTEAELQLDGVTKHFGRVTAVDSVDLEVRRGEFLTLLGPSGSGKTTILRMVAGFEAPTSGRILLDGEDVSHSAPWARDVGMVFQNYALFPHMSVADNIAYGLKMRGRSRRDRANRVEEMLETVHLAGLGHRLPRELSGGQQQRVALARALAPWPKLLLMDEPLGALDRSLRFVLAEELRRLHRELGATIMHVTHDQEEAITVSDRIAVMRGGSILALSSPVELYNRPPSAFVAQFLGAGNLVDAEIIESAGRVVVRALGRQIRLPGERALVREGAAQLLLPSHCITLSADLGAEPVVTIEGTVLDAVFVGQATDVVCDTAFGRITARVRGVPGLEAGDRTTLTIPEGDVVLVAADL